MKNKWLIYSGLLTPIVFWTTTIICGFIQGNYNHTTQLVSELGAIGTESRYVFTAGLITCSILSVLFIVRLYRIAKLAELNTIPILTIATYSFSIGGAALFPLPLRLHEILGMPSIFLYISPLLSLMIWKTKIIPSIKYYSALSLAVMLLGFLIFSPNILKEHFGIKQRFFHIGWSVWFIYLAIVFAGIENRIGIAKR